MSATLTDAERTEVEELVVTVQRGDRNAGRVHRGTCRRAHAATTVYPPAIVGAETLQAAAAATCCKPSARQVGLVRAYAAEQLAARRARPIRTDPCMDEG